MNRLLIGGIAMAAVLSAMFAVQHSRKAAPIAVAPGAVMVATGSTRKVLYWKAPDGSNAFSAEPKKAADGRDYVAVYEDQEPDRITPAPAAAPRGNGKLLYYRNPMGLADTSPSPKKDWMGMDYIAVYEGEDDGGTTVRVSLDKVQRSGVKTAPVEMRRMDRRVRAPGIAKPDERSLYTLTLRADGFVEKLYVNETGRHVKAGESLFRVYSPAIVKVLVDYRIAITAPGQSPRDEEGALQRLRNLAIPETVIAQLRTNPNLATAIDWPSPVSGVVMKKPVMEGMMVKAGDEMFRFADLSTVWVIADVAEQDIEQIKVGNTARLSFRAFPGETFQGTVTFILHELEMATRTAKVRIEVKNPDLRLKHEMFADVEIIGAAERDRLVVPASALIDSGNRQVVLIERGEGRFEPRAVKIGARSDGFVEIIEGVKAGEMVVVTATFLIDAESNLKAALQAFTAEPAAELEAKP